MIDLFKAHETLADFKDPFSKDCVIAVSTWSSIMFGEWKHTGRVRFKNGNTNGEQNFEGTSLAEVLKKMELFVQSL